MDDYSNIYWDCSKDLKFRFQIRNGYGDFLNDHLDKILQLKKDKNNELFLSMFTEAYLVSYNISLKDSPDLLLLKTNSVIDVDTILEEEFNRANDIYPKLFFI